MNLRERIDQLEERERKLLMIFGAVVGATVLILVPLVLAMSVSSQESDNERVRSIIQQIADERVTLGKRQAEIQRVERRYARVAPALAGFLAKTADEVGVEIPETQDRATVPHGKTFKERVTKIRLRQVGMLALSNFLEKIETSGYPLSVSRLNIRKRGTKPDEFDVELEVSAFDREVPKKKPKAAKPTALDGEDGGAAEAAESAEDQEE
jgi:general secretion pathway protein M